MLYAILRLPYCATSKPTSNQLAPKQWRAIFLPTFACLQQHGRRVHAELYCTVLIVYCTDSILYCWTCCLTVRSFDRSIVVRSALVLCLALANTSPRPGKTHPHHSSRANAFPTEPKKNTPASPIDMRVRSLPDPVGMTDKSQLHTSI